MASMLRAAALPVAAAPGQTGPAARIAARCGPSRLSYVARRRQPVVAAAAGPEGGAEPEGTGPSTDAGASRKAAPLGKGVNLFDPAATLSRLITRRFGIVGGLAFVAALAAIEGGEIIKAVREDLGSTSDTAPAFTLPSGLVLRDLKAGGGATPAKGDFVGVSLVISELPAGVDPSPDAPLAAAPAAGRVLLDTKARGRPIAFVFGQRPLAGVLCAGLEEGLATMKRGGVRQLDIPPGLAFGAAGAVLPSGEAVGPNASLRYTVTLDEVSPAYFLN